MATIKQEAMRCLKCKNARCSAHCPVSTAVAFTKKAFAKMEDYLKNA